MKSLGSLMDEMLKRMPFIRYLLIVFAQVGSGQLRALDLALFISSIKDWMLAMCERVYKGLHVYFPSFWLFLSRLHDRIRSYFSHFVM